MHASPIPSVSGGAPRDAAPAGDGTVKPVESAFHTLLTSLLKSDRPGVSSRDAADAGEEPHDKGPGPDGEAENTAVAEAASAPQAAAVEAVASTDALKLASVTEGAGGESVLNLDKTGESAADDGVHAKGVGEASAGHFPAGTGVAAPGADDEIVPATGVHEFTRMPGARWADRRPDRSAAVKQPTAGRPARNPFVLHPSRGAAGPSSTESVLAAGETAAGFRPLRVAHDAGRALAAAETFPPGEEAVPAKVSVETSEGSLNAAPGRNADYAFARGGAWRGVPALGESAEAGEEATAVRLPDNGIQAGEAESEATRGSHAAVSEGRTVADDASPTRGGTRSDGGGGVDTPSFTDASGSQTYVAGETAPHAGTSPRESSHSGGTGTATAPPAATGERDSADAARGDARPPSAVDEPGRPDSTDGRTNGANAKSPGERGTGGAGGVAAQHAFPGVPEQTRADAAAQRQDAWTAVAVREDGAVVRGAETADGAFADGSGHNGGETAGEGGEGPAAGANAQAGSSYAAGLTGAFGASARGTGPAGPSLAETVASQLRGPVDDIVAELVRTPTPNGRAEQVSIRLRPEFLGEVVMRISVDADGVVTARFVAEHAYVRNMIEQQLPELRDVLEQRGLQLGEATVSGGDAGLARDSGPVPEEAVQRPRHGAAAREEAVGDSSEDQRISSVLGENLVDIRV